MVHSSITVVFTLERVFKLDPLFQSKDSERRKDLAPSTRRCKSRDFHIELFRQEVIIILVGLHEQGHSGFHSDDAF